MLAVNQNSGLWKKPDIRSAAALPCSGRGILWQYSRGLAQEGAVVLQGRASMQVLGAQLC